MVGKYIFTTHGCFFFPGNIFQSFAANEVEEAEPVSQHDDLD